MMMLTLGLPRCIVPCSHSTVSQIIPFIYSNRATDEISANVPDLQPEREREHLHFPQKRFLSRFWRYEGLIG